MPAHLNHFQIGVDNGSNGGKTREHQTINEELTTVNSELQSRNDALIASEERFRALCAHAPIGIFELTSTGHLAYVNAYLAYMFRNEPDDLITRAVIKQGTTELVNTSSYFISSTLSDLGRCTP